MSLVQLTRREFGFPRTFCSCEQDILNCYLLPACLIPADLPRMMQAAGYTDPFAYGRDHLLASPGALVGTLDGNMFHVPSLVPNRTTHGGCRFLGPNDKCSIHEVSPYGCAFFDVHLEQHDADEKSYQGIRATLEDHRAGGIYSQVWRHLNDAGLKSPPAVIQKLRLAAPLRLLMSGASLSQVKQSQAWPFPESAETIAAQLAWSIQVPLETIQKENRTNA